MQESVLLLFVTIAFALAIYIFSTSFHFKKWGFTKDENLLFLIPVVTLIFSFVGSFITVGYKGSISLIFPFLLLGIRVLGGVSIQKPTFNTLIIIALAFIPTFIFVLKFISIYNFQTDSWNLSHSDNYLYIQQINTLITERTESLSTELVLKAFSLDYHYEFYHYMEFYLVCLLKTVFPLTSYLYVNLFLPAIFSTLAIIETYIFFKIRFENKVKPTHIFLLVLILFTCMRFTLFDDSVHSLFRLKGFDLLVLQNFYAAHPLSYFRTYKIAIAVLFLIPILHFSGKKHWTLDGLLIGISTLVSVALMPASVAIAFFQQPQINKISSKIKAIHWGILSIFLIIIAALLQSKFGLIHALKDTASFIQQVFNNLFENHFFILFSFACIVALFVRNRNILAFGLLIALFPFIYFAHQILFKVYIILAVLAIIFTFRNTSFRYPIGYFGLAILILMLVSKVFYKISNINQLYSNLLFLFVLLFLVSVILEHANPSKLKFLILLSPIWLVINGYSIVSDNKMPVKEEKLPAELVKELCFIDKTVNVLSIAKFTQIPFLLNNQLGWSFFHVTDHIRLVQGGYEFLEKNQLKNLKATGFMFPVSRSVFYGKKMDNLEIQKDFLLGKFKYFLVESGSPFEQYHDFASRYAKKKFYVENGNYWCYSL